MASSISTTPKRIKGDHEAQQHKGGKKENNGSTDINRPSGKACHFVACRLGVIETLSGNF
jgi:hypothetical protein